MKSLREELKHHLEGIDQQYKEKTDMTRRQEFLSRVWSCGSFEERNISSCGLLKMKLRMFGPCKILKKFD